MTPKFVHDNEFRAEASSRALGPTVTGTRVTQRRLLSIVIQSSWTFFTMSGVIPSNASIMTFGCYAPCLSVVS